MATGVNGRSFKLTQEHFSESSRPRSPDQPPVEPLSPIVGPAETAFTRFFKSYKKTSGSDQHKSSSGWSSARSVPYNGYQLGKEHRRKSSNTIDELAQVAIARGAAQVDQIQKPSYSSSNGFHPNAPHVSTWSSTPDRFHESFRPNTDSQKQASMLFSDVRTAATLKTSTEPTEKIEAAKLLLALSWQPPKLPTNGYSTHNAEIDPHPQVLEDNEARQAVEPRASHDSGVVSYLPSPRTSSEEYKYRQEMAGHEHGAAMGDMLPDDSLVEEQSYIQTPPEDETQATPSQREQDGRKANLVVHVNLLQRSRSVPPSCRFTPGKPKSNAGRKPLPKFTKETVCEDCKVARESLIGEMDQWISCNGCKKWFHSDCAGFQNERELRDVDKFFCKACQDEHGVTTFVRKSTRAHTSVDYAGLAQGVLRTSDDCHEHHYIQPIKDGTFTFDPEVFPRMPPELVTADYFERSACFNQPILIPAEFNPKPAQRLRLAGEDAFEAGIGAQSSEDPEMIDDFEYDVVHDDGQDKLDMVIPQNLTVRHVCNLVGPDYPIDVIDVKAQNSKAWNLGKWADYYELEGEKAIRNVISLEVAETKLGRLLRRPKIVRDIDLQDHVWPADDPHRSVAFYCLMSVADCFTDFHIDFGGSSVYYHILRGSKTFFFIPPKPKHLKAYEDWNNSPEQNFTFLPHITKECYRVDLFEGDTMLIPSGWIHAVWTPSNSLVIGGNFLTRMHFDTQFRVVDVEKANKTPIKFRYPRFQKVMWYAVLKYLKDDPLPDEVRHIFYSGEKFKRDMPTWQEFDLCQNKADQESQNYHARYYSQMELDGLPELVNYIFRTVMVSMDRIEGMTVETRKSVVSSIPKGYGDPLDNAKTFALWVAWKRGNEDPPAWAHPDFGLPDKEGMEPKKLSAKTLKQKQRQEAFEAYKTAPERQSARQRQQESVKATLVKQQEPQQAPQMMESPQVQQLPQTQQIMQQAQQSRSPLPFPENSPKTSLGPRRVACDACRRRRIRCKHKEETSTPGPASHDLTNAAGPLHSSSRRPSREFQAVVIPRSPVESKSVVPRHETDADAFRALSSMSGHAVVNSFPQIPVTPQQPIASFDVALSTQASGTDADTSAKRGRSKACPECRKSKRRCVHDENGNVDPVKEKQTPVPRSTTIKKRKTPGDGSPDAKRPKKEDHFLTQMSLAELPAEPATEHVVPDRSPSVQEEAVQQSYVDIGLVLDPQLAALTDGRPLEPRLAGEQAPADPGTSFEQFAAQALDYSNTVATGNSTPVIAQEPDSKTEAEEQTPSANDPPSLSSASSPLSTPGSSPEPAARGPPASKEAITRHSSRHSKPVERFSTGSFEGSKLSSLPSPVKSTKSIVTNGADRRKRKNRSSPSPAPNEAVTTSPASKKAKTPLRARDKQASKTPQPMQVKFEVTGALEEEDEDLRLARELASESFNLRRRKSIGG
ncbi:hypothetical protein ANO11243_045700 [Dothideomycetidae sp. 11243]|nr:hypothetical protein ANO11243_045700 [fungal sp. No.11243]